MTPRMRTGPATLREFPPDPKSPFAGLDLSFDPRFPPQFHGHVLVAEDSPVNQMVAQKIIQVFGCSVDVVASGQDAVRAAGSRTYDLIFLDCRMPGMTGYEAARAIRALEHGRRVPIVALTAEAARADRERSEKTGMNDLLSKPITAEAVFQILLRWLPGGRAQGEKRQP